MSTFSKEFSQAFLSNRMLWISYARLLGCLATYLLVCGVASRMLPSREGAVLGIVAAGFVYSIVEKKIPGVKTIFPGEADITDAALAGTFLFYLLFAGALGFGVAGLIWGFLSYGHLSPGFYAAGVALGAALGLGTLNTYSRRIENPARLKVAFAISVAVLIATFWIPK